MKISYKVTNRRGIKRSKQSCFWVNGKANLTILAFFRPVNRPSIMGLWEYMVIRYVSCGSPKTSYTKASPTLAYSIPLISTKAPQINVSCIWNVEGYNFPKLSFVFLEPKPLKRYESCHKSYTFSDILILIQYKISIK